MDRLYFPLNVTGSFQGTASWAINAVSGSVQVAQSGSIIAPVASTLNFKGIEVTTSSGVVNISSEPVSKIFIYNPNGNIISASDSRGIKIFSYNIDGTLASITASGNFYRSKSFVYDATGSLISSSVV